MTKSSTEPPSTDTPSHVAHVYVGDVDFGPWLLQLQIESRVNETTRANVVLKQEAAITGPLDYFGLVRISVEVEGIEHDRFSGSIERTFKGTHGGQKFIRLECEGFHRLRDKAAPPFARENLTTSEFIWTVARTAGYSENMLDIEGIDQIEAETVEVAVPLYGVQLDQDFQIGQCLITGPASVEWATGGWPDEELVAAFRRAPAFVVLHTQAKLLLDAEREAMHAAAVVAGWLAVRLRYGAAVMPNGSMEVFDRDGAVCIPYVGAVVATRGTASGRRWLRVPRVNKGSFRTALPASRLTEPTIDLGNSLKTADSEAILAFHRSLTTLDPLASVITLWDAINFYVARMPVPPMFDDQDLKIIAEHIPDTLSAEKRRAMKEKVKRFNDPPLMARLDAALRRDGVPIHPSELKLLRRLRNIRNPAQHGTVAPVPDEDDLARAWSIVARMLTYRAHRVAQEKAGHQQVG